VSGTLKVGPLDTSSRNADQWEQWPGGNQDSIRTKELSKQRGRTAEFEAAWTQCWRYFSMMLGTHTPKGSGKGFVSWDRAALLYNFFLRKTWGKGKLRIRLSDVGLTNQRVMTLSRLKFRKYMKEAMDLLVATGVVEITDVSPKGDDWTFELMDTGRGRHRPFISSWGQEFVSREDKKFRTIDTSAIDDELILKAIDAEEKMRKKPKTKGYGK